MVSASQPQPLNFDALLHRKSTHVVYPPWGDLAKLLSTDLVEIDGLRH
jgi:hypothetical protein